MHAVTPYTGRFMAEADRTQALLPDCLDDYIAERGLQRDSSRSAAFGARYRCITAL